MPKTLADFIDEVAPVSHLRVEKELGGGFVRLRVDEAERRQAAHDIRSSEDIIIEMLRNARDAHATTIYVATSTNGGKRTIVMIDDGDGIPPNLHEAVFEPRVTSKLDTIHNDRWGVHGRGMALYAVKTNTENAHVAWSQPNRGTSIVATSSLSTLPEKSDQSTFPTMHYDGDGQISIRGPRNILRTACEFVFEERDNLTVYLGSPVEIAATMYRNSLISTTATQRLCSIGIETASITQLFAYCSDAKDVMETASQIGLDISERTAFRILNDEVEPLEPLLSSIVSRFASSLHSRLHRNTGKDLCESKSKVRFAREDLDEFSISVEPQIRNLLEKYYFETTVEPIFATSGDYLTIKIPLHHQ